MGTIPPENYLACDGTVLNIEDYPYLADFFEAQFGTKNNFGGDGTTTFALPDLRGEFLRGTGTNSHSYCGSGANVGVHQDPTRHPSIFVAGNYAYSPVVGDSDMTPDTQKNGDYNRCYWGTTNEGHPWGRTFTARPTNTSILYCIKAV